MRNNFISLLLAILSGKLQADFTSRSPLNHDLLRVLIDILHIHIVKYKPCMKTLKTYLGQLLVALSVPVTCLALNRLGLAIHM